MFGQLGIQLLGLICVFAGHSQFVLFAGAAAIITFLIMMLMGEAKGHLSTLMRIAFAITALISLASIMSYFGLAGLSCN